MSDGGDSRSSAGNQSAMSKESEKLVAADQDDLEGTSSFESGVFGVLFTVSKEKSPSKAFVGFRLFMDWLQVFLMMVNPAYGWDIDAHNKLWQIFSFLQLNYFMSVRGYTFFLICMYIMAAALAANLGLCLWVANSFKNNSFNHVWPIIWLRYFSLVFYQVLDVASVTLFLMAMDCQYFSVDQDVQGFNQEFPEVYCWRAPHVIHVGVAAVSIATFSALALIFTMAEIELDPLSRNLMSMAHSKVEVTGLCLKVLMNCCTVFVTGTRWMSVLLLIGSFFLCYLYLKWLPHMHELINHIRVGSYFTVFWAALLLTIMAYNPGLDIHDDDGKAKQAKAITIALWALLVPVGLAGAALSWWRSRYFAITVVDKFRSAPIGMKPHRIHKFEDPREVEVVARCCRMWIDGDVLDVDAVALAEMIIKAGVAQLPGEAFMSIWWSSFLIDVHGSYQSGYSELQNAKKMPNVSFLERFCIFIREQEHTQKASAATSGDNANVDLVSYVEFQRNYRLAMQLHMDALVAKRTFWEVLLHRAVTFSKLAAAVARIEDTVRASERMYKQVLTRHSNSVKIILLYVKFLQGVRNDPWGAARWSSELEKIQRAEEEANEQAVFGNAGGEIGVLNKHDESKGVVIMGANCLIRVINEPAAKMLGYANRNDLLGKNINIIVPPPFSRNHNTYVRNYIETGQGKILNVVVELVAMHRDRYVIPINVYATKVSGVGEDSVFMGIFSPVQTPPNMATLWILNKDVVLSCDSEFTDWLGYKHEDIHGKAVTDLVVNKEELDQFLRRIHLDVTGTHRSLKVRRSEERTLATSRRSESSIPLQRKWTISGIEFRHMYIDLVVPVDMTVSVGGISDTSMLVCRMSRAQSATPALLVTDNKGRINHATSTLAMRLGSTSSKLQAGGMLHALDTLLPSAVCRLHHMWYRDKTEPIPPWSCRSGLSVCVAGTSPDGPTIVPFSMKFHHKEMSNKELVNVVQLEARTVDEMMDERRLELTLDGKGIVVHAGASPPALFGLSPSALVGKHMRHFINVLSQHRPGAPATPGHEQAEDEAATRVLMRMAERTYEFPGISWRVGVMGIMEREALAALGPMGAAMISKTIVPTVMVVRPHLEIPQLDGATMRVPTETMLKVELWRADMLAGVLEVDAQGVVSTANAHQQPTFNAHLVLGLPHRMLQGLVLSSLVPAPYSQSLLEALFTDGALGLLKPGTGRGSGSVRSGGLAGGAMRGQQRSGGRPCGPMHTVQLCHGADGQELEVCLQAAVKQDVGVGCSLYVLLHLSRPAVGRQDFWSWIWGSPTPAVMNRSSVCGVNGGKQALTPSWKQAALRLRRISGLDKPKATFVEPDVDGRLSAESNMCARSMDVRAQSASATVEQLERAPSLAKRSEGAMQKHSGTEPLSPKLMAQHTSLHQNAGPLTPVRLQRDALHRAHAATLASGATQCFVVRSECVQWAAGSGSDGSGSQRISASGGLTHPGVERITQWVSNIELDPDQDYSEHIGGEDGAMEHAGQLLRQDVDVEQDIAQLDEASSGLNDYKRGKRLKRLVKVLLGPQAQAPNEKMRLVSIMMVTVIIIVDLAMFIVFQQLTTKQQAQVVDLRSSSEAVNRVMMVAKTLSSIEVLLMGDGVPNVHHLGQGGTAADLAYQMALLKRRTAELEYYHSGVFKGFSTPRKLPEAYGLRSLWEKPVVPVRIFFRSAYGPYAITTNYSLWDAGNMITIAANSLHQNVERLYGLDTGNSAAIVNDTNALFVFHNAPRAIMSAYQSTLDALMQVAVEDSSKMNNIQLILLAVEGLLVGTITVAIMWAVTAEVVYRRYAVFQVFLTIPTGVIRSLATQTFSLGEDEHDDDDPVPAEADGLGPGDAALSPGGPGEPDTNGELDAEQGKLMLFGKRKAEHGSIKGAFKRLAIWLGIRAPPPVFVTKRRLLPCSSAILWITWPFMLWSVIVVTINIVGYYQLAGVNESIAISNIVQFVEIRMNRVLFFAQRLAGEQYFDTTYTFTAPRTPLGVSNPLKLAYAAIVASDYDALLLEYDAMLIGHESEAVRNQTSAHFRMATEGISFTTGGELLFGNVGCLAETKSDCQAPDSPFYRFTLFGVDTLMRELLDSIEALLQQNQDDINLHSPYFHYIYEVGTADIRGGLAKLVNNYSEAVQAVYKVALDIHIFALSICVALAFVFHMFIMRITFKRNIAESRRVAELMSALPPDVNVEALVQQALAIHDMQEDDRFDTTLSGKFVA